MERVPIKHLIEREGIASILFIVSCLALALLFQVLVGTSNIAPALAHAKAPWIFGPVQVLLLYLPAWLGALTYPFMVVAGLLSIPFIAKYFGERAARVIFFGIVLSVVLLLIAFVVKEYWWV